LTKTSASVPYPVIVGGHICLDIIPSIRGAAFGLVPGKLVNIGEAVLSTGGAVANTGIALHRLGMKVRLMGKVGDDIFGEAILSIVRREHDALADGMIVAEGEASSYSIVISPPQVDRMFLHCTGANDTFGSDDVKTEELEEAGLFHFGYPPLMRRMYANGGEELIRLMRRAKAAGATTSLDMARPDPDADAGRVDWRRLLADLLPSVDLFLPSIEEILFMLRRERYEELLRLHGSDGLLGHVDDGLLGEVSGELLAMGAAVVVLKLGEHGLYLRTTAAAGRLADTGRYGLRKREIWTGRELYVPCFRVEAVGTTGAGDCTIAGFLAGFIQGLTPEETIIGAVGTGACNVEQPDATSGIPSWEAVRLRIASGWRQNGMKLALPGYLASNEYHALVYRGTRDRFSNKEE